MKSKLDLSVGIVPYKEENSKIKFLLIQHKKGKHWGFPKGHPEPEESRWETAQRELFEEVGLKIVKCKEERFNEHYSFAFDNMMIHKKVIYFVSEVKGEVQEQKEEVSAHLWLDAEEVLAKLSFDNAKCFFKEVLQKCFL